MLIWGLRLLALTWLASWVIPVENSYSATPKREQARFRLGWPNTWYTSEVSVTAGIIAHPPEFKIETRPWAAVGRDRLWMLSDSWSEPFPSNLPSFTGWNPAVCRRRSEVHWTELPFVPTILAMGCFYISWRLGQRKGPNDAVATPAAEVQQPA